MDLATLASLRTIKRPPRNIPARGAGGDLPIGLNRGQVSLEEDFEPPFDQDDYDNLLREGLKVAAGERLRLNLRAVVVEAETGWSLDDPRAAPVVPDGYKVDELGRGVSGLKYVGEDCARIRVMLETEVDKLKKDTADDDAGDPRVLPLRTLATTGKRGRTWESVAYDTQPEEIESFPIEGPRVAA